MGRDWQDSGIPPPGQQLPAVQAGRTGGADEAVGRVTEADEGPSYQDWQASHVKLPDFKRRVRIYTVRTGATEDERRTTERAAEREAQLLESLQHPGVLRREGFTEHELGPALIFEHAPQGSSARSPPTAKLDVTLTTVARLADVARHDPQFMEVGELYRDDPAFDVQRLAEDLVTDESVPLLPVLRYKAAGLRKRAEWEKTWELQRAEDVIDARTKLPGSDPDHLTEIDAEALKRREVGDIPVPPKYKSSDFLNGTYWRLRGKLDLPKERWVSFPHCEGEDGTMVIAWAGYDHLQLARAISVYYVDVQERLGGRDAPRLVPLLACLIELLPWLKQWHNEVDPEFGMAMGDYFEGFINEEARQLCKTVEEVKAWQPPKKGKKKGRKKQG